MWFSTKINNSSSRADQDEDGEEAEQDEEQRRQLSHLDLTEERRVPAATYLVLGSAEGSRS